MSSVGASWTSARGEQFPAKPIRWVVPYPPGGGSDFLARTIGQQVSQQTKQSIVVDNKPGANTAIAAADVARSPADGYTILNADNGTMVFNSALYSKLGYNPLKDLAPVTLMGIFPMILVAGPALPVRDGADFLATAKAKPGRIDFASVGAGSPHHLAMEMLKVTAGLHLVHIPYRGASLALSDLAGGQVGCMMVDLAAGAAFIKANRIRPLAVAHATRLEQLPAVPTFAELGIKGFEAAAQVGVVAPAGTPAPIVSVLHQQIASAIETPAIRRKLVEFGIEPVASTPQAYEELLGRETTRWHRVIKEQGIRLE